MKTWWGYYIPDMRRFRWGDSRWKWEKIPKEGNIGATRYPTYIFEMVSWTLGWLHDMVRYTEFGCPGDTSLLPTQPKDRFHPLVVLQFNPPSACPQLRGKHLVFWVGPVLKNKRVGRWTASLWDQVGAVHVLQSFTGSTLTQEYPKQNPCPE